MPFGNGHRRQKSIQFTNVSASTILILLFHKVEGCILFHEKMLMVTGGGL